MSLRLSKLDRLATKRFDTARPRLLALVPEAAEYIEMALAGDADAAGSLISRASNETRGKLARILWRARVPAKVLRQALQDAWDHDPGWTWSAFGYPNIIQAFRDARFPTDHLPETFLVWRGVHGKNFSMDAGTLSRDIACWFAFRFSDGEPRVFRRTVQRVDVLAHLTAREEDEIVLDIGDTAEIDGDPADWRARCERERARRREEHQEIMTRHQHLMAQHQQSGRD
jgi:hypothetical protein